MKAITRNVPFKSHTDPGQLQDRLSFFFFVSVQKATITITATLVMVIHL